MNPHPHPAADLPEDSEDSAVSEGQLTALTTLSDVEKDEDTSPNHSNENVSDGPVSDKVDDDDFPKEEADEGADVKERLD